MADRSRSDWLTNQLRASFYLGKISTGDKLPSYRKLSRELRISPTTALRLYSELESEGLLGSKERSGTFLKQIAGEADHHPREEAMLSSIRRTAVKLKVLDVCPRDYARFLLRYVGAEFRDDFRFGFVGHREAYELAAEKLRRLCPALRLVRLSPDAADDCPARAVLGRDRTVKCLLTTLLHVDFAIELGREFARHVVLARPEQSAHSFFDVESGRTRYVLTRDRSTAADLNLLIGKVLDKTKASRFVVASIEDQESLETMEKCGEELVVSPLARSEAMPRFGGTKCLVPIPGNLSEDTVDEMLFHYLFA